MTKTLWITIYTLLLLLAGTMILLYFQGIRWPSFYGSTLHKISRLHIVLVHCTVGTLLLLSILEGFFFIKPMHLFEFLGLRIRFHHFAHLLTLASICLGLIMEMIESYPNPLITSHVYSALFLYAGLICFSALCFWRRWGRWSCVGAIGFVAIVLNTAHLGGLIQKGTDFFYK